MKRDDSDRIMDFFTASSRDLTPESARHSASLFNAPVSHDPEVTKLCASILSQDELQKADRFVAYDAKALFTQRRAFRRFCGVLALGTAQPLSQIEFKETEKGRPYLSDLPEVWFSFSSCRFGFLGVWSATHAVGVDFEDRTRKLEAAEIARLYFSGAEASAVESAGGPERLRTFFQFWTLKEAALKSIGEGLPFGLDSFEFVLDPNPSLAQVPPGHGGADQFDAHLIDGTGSCAALVTRNRLSQTAW
jgi:4'-phosphopantetheinyl transferase